jgi:hypothetical protein
VAPPEKKQGDQDKNARKGCRKPDNEHPHEPSKSEANHPAPEDFAHIWENARAFFASCKRTAPPRHIGLQQVLDPIDPDPSGCKLDGAPGEVDRVRKKAGARTRRAILLAFPASADPSNEYYGPPVFASASLSPRPSGASPISAATAGSGRRG